MSGGYGRGGRGAALLEALNAPARKPGQNGAGDATSTKPTSPPTLGRGAYLASLLQSTSIDDKPESGSGYGMGRGLGRGIPQQLAEQPPTQQPAGRGIVRSPQGSPHAPLLMGRGMAPYAGGTTSPVSSSPAPMSPVPQSGSGASGGSSSGSSGGAKRQPPKTKTDKPTIIKHGSDGKPIPLYANHIRLKSHIEHIYQFAVSYSPETDNRNIRRRLLFEHSDVLGQVRCFDGMSLFLPKTLPYPEMQFNSTRHDGTPVIVTVKLVRKLLPEECVNIYNVILRRIFHILQMNQVGRHWYDPRHPASIPQHKLEVWPGYVTAIKRHEGGLLLLTDVSHRVIRTDTVLDVLKFLYQKSKGWQDEAVRVLVGCTVLTRYNNKTYRVDDIKFDMNPKCTFTSTKDSKEISFVEYYQQMHNKTIHDLNQPLLINRPKKREQGANKSEMLCLIPELCYMTGLTDEIRQDFRVMKDIAVHTRVTPNQRQMSLKKFIHNVNSTPEAKDELFKWGITLEGNTLQLDGRKLPNEEILFRNRKITANNEADWGRDVVKNDVIQPVDIRNWLLIFTGRDKPRAMEFKKTFRQVAPQMGIQVQEPDICELNSDRTDAYLSSIRSRINPQLQLVVTIFPTSRDDRYNAVKKQCYVESPVASQVINSRTLDPKKLRSVTQKIALQINAKLGGELWALNVPLKGLMVIGIDSYHEGKTGKGRSVGGFVASINPQISRWYSRVCQQHAGQELIDGLKPCMLAAILKYKEVNGYLPERYVLFRDGVGDGQLEMVGGYEVEQMVSCFHHFGESYQPKFAAVVVQKRINTRLFLNMGGNNLDNPPPGTVVDHTITRRDWYDFFLISQNVRQGTVTPTHYVVVNGGDDMKIDHMQRLSYKMTHMYYNWPGTVRVPAPCQYAHKLAYLVGQNLQRDPSLELCDKLFFL